MFEVATTTDHLFYNPYYNAIEIIYDARSTSTEKDGH